jgi:hypothetical protein
MMRCPNCEYRSPSADRLDGQYKCERCGTFWRDEPPIATKKGGSLKRFFEILAENPGEFADLPGPAEYNPPRPPQKGHVLFDVASAGAAVSVLVFPAHDYMRQMSPNDARWYAALLIEAAEAAERYAAAQKGGE